MPSFFGCNNQFRWKLKPTESDYTSFHRPRRSLISAAGKMSASAYDDEAPLPLDEKCLHGTLSNGLTYYIQNNKKPEARAELRLVVKIGSVFEEDDEQGLAHMVEHLAFRGTKLYDTFEVVRYLESVGAKFGACQNAYTSFDETVFEQHIPIDKEGLLDKSLTVLKEWAYYVRCTDDDVEAERAVVFEEWRQGRSAAGRSDEDYFQTLMGGSLYARRLPIGKLDIINNAKPATVRGFYQRWYHPRRMAIIAVGDFDAFCGGCSQVLQKIDELFNVTPPHKWTPAQAPAFESQGGIKVSFFSDAEATSSGVSVDCKRARQPVSDHKDYKRTIIEHLFHEAMSARLYKLAVSDEPPFYSASTAISFPCSTMETMNLSLSAEEGDELRGLEAALTEIERVRRFGFGAAEIERAKANLLSDLEADIAEREQMESGALSSSFVEHFCRAEPAMGVEYDVSLTRNILEHITLVRNPQPSTLNPQPSTLNPQPSTLNPQPSTLNPQP
jgi:predicted Zn-dependent peptidase